MATVNLWSAKLAEAGVWRFLTLMH